MKVARIFLQAMVILTLNVCVARAQAQYNRAGLNVARISSNMRDRANAVVRSYQERIAVSKPGRASRVIDKAVTVFSKEGASEGRFSISYNKFNSISDIKYELYDAKGIFIRSILRDEIHDVSAAEEYYSDIRNKIFGIEYGVYPYTVVVHFEINYSGYVGLGEWRPVSSERIGCEYASLELIVAGDQKCRIRKHGIQNEAVITQNEDRQRYFLTLDSIPCMYFEAYGPDLKEQLPYVEIVPDEFALGDYKGSCRTWKELAKSYNDLNAGRDEIPEVCAKEVEVMVSGITSNREKVERLYKYLQSTTRYVNIMLGIGGFQANDATYVYKNKYGDCKALTNYMKALLKSAGIQSFPALVNSGDDARDIDPGFPCQDFNHVILLVPLEKDTIWLECTSQESPFDFLGEFTQSRYVLAIFPDDGILLRTPTAGKDQNATYKKLNLSMNEDGSGHLTLIQRVNGQAEIDMNRLFTKTDLKSRNEWIADEINIVGAEFSKVEFDYRPLENELSKLIVEMNVPKCAAISASRWFLDLNIMDKWERALPSVAKRKSNLVNKFAWLTSDTLIFHVPPSLKIEDYRKDPVKLSSDFGSYYSNIETDESTKSIKYIRYQEMNSFDFSADRYNEFRTYIGNIIKADKTQAILLKE